MNIPKIEFISQLFIRLCLLDTRFGMNDTEIESLYHAIITVSSYIIEINRIQVVIETEK